MEEINKNDISEIAGKMGKLILISVFVQIFYAIFLISPLVNILHEHEYLSKCDPLEIDIIIRSSMHTLSTIIIAKHIFNLKIKDMFLNKKRMYKLSLNAKIKLTLFFTSIGLFSLIVSSFIVTPFNKYIIPLPKSETRYYLSIFSLSVVPVIEETLYRGIILNELKDGGYLFSIIISSICFGMMHGIGFIHATVLGLIAGFAFTLTGNIIWSIILHFLHNFRWRLIDYFFLPLFPKIGSFIGTLIMGIILLLIFLILSIRDKEIREIHKKINIKNIMNEFKKDKEKYSIFINEPEIVFLIGGWITIQLIPLIAKIF